MAGNDSKYVYQTEANFVKKEEPTYDTSRKISKTDYDKILEASVKSNKSDREIADILKMRNFSDNDIDVILAERKKKRTPELTESELLAEASRLDSSITKKFPKEKIDLINYSSFNDYKNIKAPDLEISSPNDLFDHLIDNDEDYQNEVKAYDEALTTTDEDIAKELGVLDDFESWKETKRKNEVKDKSTLLTIANPKRYSPSKNASAAYKAVQEEKKRRGMPEQLDTDDPEARKEKIRAKYYEKYGREYNDIFKTNLMQNLPENLRNDEEFLKDVENTMHWGDVSVDLTGDGKIYNKNILDSSINVAAVSFAEMAVSGLALIAGALETTVMATEELEKGLDGLGDRIDKRLQYSGDDDIFAVSNKLKEVRDGLEYYRSKEGQRVMGDVDLGEALTGRNQTINENPLVLVNESLTLLAKSAPYMVGAGYFQGASRAAGLTISGSKSLAAMTTSTVGMGALSGSSYYMSVMGQDWFSEMSPAQRVTLATVNGLAEGLGESVSAHIFNRMITPALKGISGEAAKKTFGEFIKATAYSYGTSVSEEAAAEAATALVQTKYELEAQGKQATWERLKEPLMEAVDSAVLMTGGMQTVTTAVRAPFEVQNLHIAGKLGLGMDKLRSRAVIKQLSEEYQNAADKKTKGIIGAQLAKALAKEGMRNKQNAEFFERIRQESPEDHAKLMQIADTFQSKVDQWNSMPEGAAKSELGAEIKADFQEKLAIEEKYKGLQSVQSASNMSAEAISIAQKIKQGESLTMEEESFYAENQAEVEQAVSDAGGKELYVPFEMEKGKLQPTIEYDGKEGFLADLINHFETIGEQVFEGFKTTKDAAIKGLQSIENAVKAIKAVRPDAKVFVHTSAQAFKDATGLDKLTRGYFMKGNEIHFLAPAMVSTTGYHEATHGAFGEVLGNKSFDALFGEIAKMVKQSGIEGVAVGSAIQRFIAGYEAGNRSEEGVTEFIAMLAAGKFDIQIEKGILRKIAEVIGNALGFEVPIPSRTQGVQIMKDIAASMREGEPIDPNDIERLRKRKDKGQKTGDKAQAAGVDVNNLEEGDPIYDYLKGLDIVPEDLEWMGGGHFGEAYSDGDGTIVKFTLSNNELETAQEILAATGGKKKLIDLAFAEIEDAVEIDGNKIIIMEELDTDGAEELFEELDSMAQEAGVPLSEFWIDTDEVTEVDGDLIKGLDHLDDIFRAYRALGIWAADVKGDNLGFDKDGKLKAFDIQERGKSQIIGENGNLRPEVAGRLEQAKQFYDMIKEGRSKEETERILQESFGWTVGADGKWRYEIEYPKIKARIEAGTNIKGAKLSDIIDTELFEVYPESKDIVIDINVAEDGTGRAEAWYSPSQNTIEIQVKTPSAVRTYLVHELQHWVQHREMMATGGSFQTFFGGTQEAQKLYEQIIEPLKPFMKARDMARYLDWFAEGAEMSGFGGNYNDMVNMSPEQIVEASDDILDEEQAEELIEFLSNLDEDILNGMTENIEENGWWEYKGHEYMANAASDYWGEVVRKSDSANGYQLYQRLAGEVESRNAETRSYYSVEQLRQKPLSTTEDVAREDQILVYPQIDITKQNFEDGSVAAQADESFISPEVGKAQVITGDAPTFSLQEALKQTEGRVLVITSDNTGIGEVDGKDVMGGIGYSFIEENLRDGVGFASVSQESVTKIKNMVQSIGNGKDVTVLIMQQAPDGMLGNFYAADYLAEAITETFKDDRKQAASEIKERLMSLTPIKNSGELDLVEKFIDGIANGSKSEAVAEVVDKMSFPLRKAIVKSLLPKGYGKVKGVERINPNARVAVSLSKRMAEAGFSQVDFWRKYSSPETRTDEYIEGALNGDWGYTYSGFVTNPSLDWGESFQQNSGIAHPQFNAKLPSKQTFKLDGGYQVDEAFKNLLTFGYNQDKGMYTVPPFGLKQSTSQSIFAGSFQESTQEAVLDLVALPDTDPFNQYHKLSSTPEGKAQIIGELGAMAGGRLEENLNLAREMEEAGKGREAIFFATGWYRGMDNLWRSEINYGFVKGSTLNILSDMYGENASLNPMLELVTEKVKGKTKTIGIKMKLEDFLENKALYRMYPSLREYSFIIEKFSNPLLQGEHNSYSKEISVSWDNFFEKTELGIKPIRKKKGTFGGDFTELMNTVYHEVQHAIQHIEQFDEGYNTGRISEDARYSGTRSRKSAEAQLKVANNLTEKILEIERNGDFISSLKELWSIVTNEDFENVDWALNDLYDFNMSSLSEFIESRGDIVDAVRNSEGVAWLTSRAPYGGSLRRAVSDANTESRDQVNTEVLEELRSKMKDFAERNKDFISLLYAVEAMQKDKTMKGTKWLLETLNADSLNYFKEVARNVAHGAALNVKRFTEKMTGGRASDYEVYQGKLGEAEARFVGQRGTQKIKNRTPAFHELYPDVSRDEIWMSPPAYAFKRLAKVEAKRKAIERANKALDNLSLDPMERADMEAENQKSIDKVSEEIKILLNKMNDKSQKGKAQLIEGTQEYDLFKKEFQEELIRNGVENFAEMQGGAYRLFEHLRFKFADKYQPLQNLQKSIEKAQGRVLSSDANFRRAEALMHGKAAEDARQFEEQKLKPLMDKMIEYGITNEQISEYLYALHARERNEFVKNTIDPANESGSGMTNEVADAIIKKYEGDKARMDELADMVYEITEASRKMMLDFGLINKAQYDSFGMFENYVPLVGTAVTPTSDLFDFTDTRSSQDMSRGGGIAIFGKEYRQVSGRFSEAQSPLETVISNHLRTISRGRKNEVLQVLLEMVQQNKDAKAWEVFTEENPDMRVRVASRGEAIFIEEATGEEYEYELRRRMAGVAMAGNNDYVPVKVKGKTFYIKFNDKRITRTLNDGGVAKTNMLVKALSKASRHFTRVFTSWNPEFIFANFTRDIQTAMYNQMAEQDMELSNISGQDFVLESLRNVPNAIKGVFQYEKGNREGMDSETKAFYEEYLQSGAKTDWFLLKSAEEIEKEMLKYIEKTKPITDEASLRDKARAVGVKGTASLAEVAKFVDVANTSIENGIRFGAYIAARKNGVPADQAAEFVKELTINFNRSGELGAVANSLYLFFNASVQGSTRLLRSVVKSKKAQKVAGGMMAFSALLTMMNIAVGGEDEDGIPMYNKIPEYERERFLIIMYGSERGNYFKIPLPYGVSMFFNMGTALSETAFGVSTPAESASFLLNGIVGSFSPISLSKSSDLGGSLLKSATPTVLKPIVELQLNENFFGSPIYKKDFYYSADTPDSQRPTKHAAEWAKTMAVFLNKATGGSDYEKGMVDLSPDTIEYLFTFLSGGTGKFINRTMDTGQKLYKGKAGDIEFNDVPLARQFLGTVRESEAAGRYYETRREILKQKNKAIGALKSGEPMTAEMKQLNRLLNLDKQVQSKVKKLAEAEKRAERIEDPVKRQELLDKLHDKKIAIYQQFNGYYYKMKQK